jgi:hypothetical protein
MNIRKRISILGFMIGSIVDVVGSNIWGVVVTIYVMISFNLLSGSPAEMTDKVLNIFRTDPLIFSLNFIVGSFFSILGGYIGAYIAKHNELLNGALSSFLCVSIGIYSIVNGSYSSSLALALASLLLSPLLGIFGGFLRLKQSSRNQIIPATS